MTNTRRTLYILFILLAAGALLGGVFGKKTWHRLENILAKEEPVSPALRPEISVRFLEGWNNTEMGEYLEKQTSWSKKDWLDVVGYPREDHSSSLDLSARYSLLADKPANAGLEGYLYPDTYRIFASSSTPEDLVIKMLDNLDKRLTPKMRADIASQGKSIFEIMTMASLLEKEAPINYTNGDNKDAKIIAGIFWDRIKNGQALQSCASLAYILGVNKPQYSAEDTQVESPYNTYQNRGLPPGPISNPGILAIEAAIYPTYTNYNYFLTPSGSKDIIYAATYEEHLRNKRQYLP
ncbi:MAG: endolytic transglycosylase MltG [Bacillota bacterium]